ncbi:MAG: MarR family winged helix-turn-helix transcriptional regulator [Acidimicrobiales bacterium]
MTNSRESSGVRGKPVRGKPGGAPIPLPWLLRRTSQRYRAAIRDNLVERGFEELPQPGNWALMVLARGATDASQLVGEMGVSKQAVSKLIDALVDGGFVDRKPNDADRRRTDLLLTTKGRRAARVIADAARATEETFVTELGAERFAELVEVLAQLARHQDRC